MFTLTDLSRYIIKNYFQLTKTSTIELIMAYGSTILCIATLVFLFIAYIRFPASSLLIGVSKQRYGRDLIKKVKALQKLDFKHNNTILDLNLPISCKKK